MKRVSLFSDTDTWHEYSTRMTFPIDEQAKFIAAFASRIDGTAFSAFVAKACVDYARRFTAGGKPLSDFWDAHPGVAWCNIFNESPERLPLDAQEKHMAEFVRSHRPFFYVRHAHGHWVPAKKAIDVLWPAITKYAAAWDKKRGTDPWAVGEQMAAALKAARLPVPEWGPHVNPADLE